ncbi:ubiquitin-specific protease ubp15 [Coemansia nantahalensis]|uniref:Ubiquitin-specific protease ubp15 n=1 Tax=Coemansia nantahalensis TaxID=2789366 RepID=A0ACC1K8V3_9FUNG|nr:ubiquitin-specific protease ubp15 [Coemansia nantahalensis]
MAPSAVAGTPKQYSGLSPLSEENFIDTNLPVPPKMEEEGHGVFHWEIDNWMQLPDRAISQTFTVAGHDWDILLFPRGNQSSEMVSLYVEYKPREATQGRDWHVCASFCLVMSNAAEPELFKMNRAHHRFLAEEADWGFTRFSELRPLVTPPDEETPALLENGRVRISAYLRVIKDPLGVLWHNFQNYNSRKHTGFVGLRNQGATCYMNSLLQSLYFTNEFRNAVYQIPTEQDDPERSVALALQRVFYNLQVSAEPVDTTELTKSFGWDSIESFMQHDVQEFNRVLQDNLETKMKGTVVDGAVARLFEGKMKSYIRCVNVEYESSRVENYYDISLNVKGCATLRDSFANYCEVETLDGENKYQAEGLGLQDARKGVIFESFPPVLQLQLKRFEYDFEQDAMVKINDRHEFPPTIDLGEFLSDDADRSEPWTYALHGVLVHSGDLHSGHYFGLLRPTVDNKWYRFDDDRVVPAAPEEVFEEYYGGEFPQQQTQMQTQQTPPGPGPGMRPRPVSKRFTNAYMLVYIREAKRDSVLCAGAAPVPAHLLQRIQQDREEEERLQREKEEIATTLVVRVVGSEQFARHQGFDLCYFDRRQTAGNPLFSERMPRDMTLAAFHEHYGARVGLPADGFRLWIMVGRQNKTIRCDHPLVGDAMGMTLAQLLQSRSPRWDNLRLFCELRPADAPADFLTARPPAEMSLIHIKFYDPVQQQVGGLGSAYVHRDQCIGDVIPALRSMAMLAPDAPVTVYEEVKPSMIEELDVSRTFVAAEIQSGDILCIQPTAMPNDRRPLARVADYFEDMQHRVSVTFAQLPARNDADVYGSGGAAAGTPEGAAAETPLALTATTKTSYDRVAQWVAEQVGMRDPLKLRFYTVSPSGQPRQPVRRMETTTLGDMLPSAMFLQPTLNPEGLPEYTVMYERLEVDIVQIESMRSVRIAYVGKTVKEELPIDVLVPKVGTAQALIEAAYGKVEQALRALQRDAEEQAVEPIALQFFAVASHRIARLVGGDDRLNDLGSPGASDVVAQRLGSADDAAAAAAAGESQMDTDEARGRASAQVEVFHFHRELAQAHSLPFLFTLYAGEPWCATWERLQAKLGMSEKELRNLGVVCGPAGATDPRLCRVLVQGGSASADAAAAAARAGSPVVGVEPSPAAAQTPPPPPPAAVDPAGSGAQLAVSRAASMQSNDGGAMASPPPEAADDMCLWDVLQQLAAVPPGELVGSIGLNHINRASRNRNLHHERAIRIRN